MGKGAAEHSLSSSLDQKKETPVELNHDNRSEIYFVLIKERRYHKDRQENGKEKATGRERERARCGSVQTKVQTKPTLVSGDAHWDFPSLS